MSLAPCHLTLLGMRVTSSKFGNMPWRVCPGRGVRVIVPHPGAAQLSSLSLQQGLAHGLTAVHIFLLITVFSEEKVSSPFEALYFYSTREKGHVNTFRRPGVKHPP